MVGPFDKNDNFKGTSGDPSKNESEVELEIEVLRHAYESYQDSLDKQLQYFPELDSKAIQLIQLNGIVLSIIAVIFMTFEVRFRDFSILMFVTLLFVMSIVSSLISYRTSSMTVGPSVSDFEVVREYRMSERQFLVWMIFSGYRNWMEHNRDIYYRRSKYLELSLSLFVLGILILTFGVVYLSYLSGVIL